MRPPQAKTTVVTLQTPLAENPSCQKDRKAVLSQSLYSTRFRLEKIDVRKRKIIHGSANDEAGTMMGAHRYPLCGIHALCGIHVSPIVMK